MITRSLNQSRWAISQSTTTKTSTNTTIEAPSSTQELARFLKIVSRLKWKLPFLSEGYRLATAEHGWPPADVANAEIMFKIDFHEYYALLERAVVHLLAVFGIVIHNSREKALSPMTNNNGRWRGAGNHRYHANVLEALERSSCPLHPVLGSGPVLEQLRRAKRLRNQWKTADSTEEDEEPENASVPLVTYNLEGMLTSIFNGLEQGHALAQKHVIEGNPEMEVEVQTNGTAVPDPSHWDHEAGWDFIVDAMDWEAV